MVLRNDSGECQEILDWTMAQLNIQKSNTCTKK